MKGIAIVIGLLVVAPSVRAQEKESFQRTAPSVLRSFRGIIEEFASKSVVTVHSEGSRVALGTVVTEDGFIVSKSSELGEGELTCRLSDGREFEAVRVRSVAAFDLALLSIDAEGLVPMVWDSENEPQPGRIVLTVGEGDIPVTMGVVSVVSRSIRGSRRGLLGVRFGESDSGARITRVTPGSPAENVGLRSGDVLIAVDGEDVDGYSAASRKIGQRAAGKTVRLQVQRGEQRLEFEPTLAERPDRGRGRQSRLEGQKSRLRGGFPKAFEHDSVVDPQQCGSPLIGLNGKAIGFNIARAGRTSTYAIPGTEMAKLVDRLLKESLVED